MEGRTQEPRTTQRRRGVIYVAAGKRAADIVFGSAFALIALPVIALLALISAVTLRTWPFFVQDRVGRNGKVFRFPKVRTLPKSAPAAVDKYETAEVKIPRWSAILRKSHLDELPQLFCVPMGTMSLVGPRPDMPQIMSRYPKAFLATRTSIRPGCTGLWQISVHNDGMIYEAPQYDEFYVHNESAAFDVWIMWRTVLSSINGRYRTTLAAVPTWAAPTTPPPVPVETPRIEMPRADRGRMLHIEPRFEIDLTALDTPTLVSGAGGFIGGHLVRHLLESGVAVRAVDVKPLEEWHQFDTRAENHVLDLRDLDACRDAVDGIGSVYNLAADVAPMGFFESRKAMCMLSVLINTHLLMASRDAKVRRFLFASSTGVADSTDEFAWEKLFSERMCRQFREDFDLETRVARFDDVYGPYGMFVGGRESAAAAVCRQVAEAVRFQTPEIEIRGAAEAGDSFTYIDDCVAGTELIMGSSFTEPVNLTSGQIVTMKELVDIVEGIAGVKLQRRFVRDAPPGAQALTDIDSPAEPELGWRPSVALEDGLERTYRWIYNCIAESQHVGA